MAYLPKNKYKVLYTNGKKYKLKTSGKPYTGEYLKLSDGRLFAGKDPSDLKGRLIPIADSSGGNKVTAWQERNKGYHTRATYDPTRRSVYFSFKGNSIFNSCKNFNTSLFWREVLLQNF